jgi:hypothetical protein
MIILLHLLNDTRDHAAGLFLVPNAMFFLSRKQTRTIHIRPTILESINRVSLVTKDIFSIIIKINDCKALAKKDEPQKVNNHKSRSEKDTEYEKKANGLFSPSS